MIIPSLNIMVNDYCNHRCKSCNIWQNTIRNSLSMDNLTALLTNITGVEDISLTGGEPFMREDLYEVAQKVIDLSPKLKMLFINTNGMFPKRVKEIMGKLSGPEIYLCVSLEGDKEAHNELRGLKAYDSAIRTLSLSGSYKKVISTTIQARNCNPHDLEHLLKVARETGSSLTFRLADNATYYNNEDTEIVPLTPKQKEYLVKIMDRNPNPFFNVQKKFIQTGEIPLMVIDDKVICKAGELFAFVKPDGNISPCIYSSRNIGTAKSGVSKVTDLGKYEPCPCCTECTVYPMINHENSKRVS